MVFTRKTGHRVDPFTRFAIRTAAVLIYALLLASDTLPPTGPPAEGPVAARGDWLLPRIREPWRRWRDYAASFTQVSGLVQKGDTLISLLKREGVDAGTAHALVDDARKVFDPKKIRAGHNYTLHFRTGALHRLRYDIDRSTYLGVHRGMTGDFRAGLVHVPTRMERDIVSGVIGHSLYVSLVERGERPELADMLARLFEYDIDFNRDIRSGDRFSALVEKRYLRGVCVSYGAILAATFVNRGRATSILRYTDPDGTTAYYHPDGRAAKKMFLRCPLPFMRVTSRYGFRRHPVLGFSARHTGVDLGAPHGTRVRVTATGWVTDLGYHRLKGNYITVRHPNGYHTHYYHLSRRVQGMRRGLRVVQGEVIGYVGRSGRATGNHLHYGVQKNGRFIDPLSLKSPSLEPVRPDHMDQFVPYAQRLMSMLDSGRIVTLPETLRESLREIVPGPAIPSGPPITD